MKYLCELRELVDKKLTLGVDKEKFLIIKELLKEDDCFFKMDMSVALSILMDLDNTLEQAKALYSKLISFDSYKEVI